MKELSTTDETRGRNKEVMKNTTFSVIYERVAQAFDNFVEFRAGARVFDDFVESSDPDA